MRLLALMGLLAASGCQGAGNTPSAESEGSSGAASGGSGAGGAAAAGSRAAAGGSTASSGDGGSVAASAGSGAGGRGGGQSSTPTGTPDASVDDAAAPDAGSAEDGIPMFVAQGHVGRTLVSCDDGQTWVADRAFDTEGDPYVCDTVRAVTCWQDGLGCQYLADGMCETVTDSCDCDHHPGAGTGLAYGNGWFTATWGWGPLGSVRRSQDGVSWQVVLDDTTFGGVAFGQDRFVLGSREPRVSRDDGATFEYGGAADLHAPSGATIWNVRALGFAPTQGGRFVLAGQDSDDRDVLVSADGAQTFSRPTSLPPECASGPLGVVGSEDAIVITHGSGLVCYSHDGGTTFETSQAGGALESRPVWAGNQFLSWGQGKVYASPDGEEWTSTATVPADLDVGAVAYSPVTGTLVAVRGGWQVWYDQQRFYRSSDGITWSTLDADDAPGGHPVRFMVFGYGKESAACAR